MPSSRERLLANAPRKTQGSVADFFAAGPLLPELIIGYAWLDSCWLQEGALEDRPKTGRERAILIS
ncbi:hypothetical protein [Pannonibacter phragmitetus]|uniref:hypothetical protein n=1 Tax=Pannonibacter phragmitetus TaxID=121719 RepID=UPI003D2F3E73